MPPLATHPYQPPLNIIPNYDYLSKGVRGLNREEWEETEQKAVFELLLNAADEQIYDDWSDWRLSLLSLSAKVADGDKKIGGKKEASLLKEKLLQTYKNRPAMRDELSQV